jgi:hypothetical protein
LVCDLLPGPFLRVSIAVSTEEYNPCHYKFLGKGDDIPPECILGKNLARNGVSVDHGGLLGIESGCLYDGDSMQNIRGRPCHCH